MGLVYISVFCSKAAVSRSHSKKYLGLNLRFMYLNFITVTRFDYKLINWMLYLSVMHKLNKTDFWSTEWVLNVTDLSLINPFCFNHIHLTDWIMPFTVRHLFIVLPKQVCFYKRFMLILSNMNRYILKIWLLSADICGTNNIQLLEMYVIEERLDLSYIWIYV